MYINTYMCIYNDIISLKNIKLFYYLIYFNKSNPLNYLTILCLIMHLTMHSLLCGVSMPEINEHLNDIHTSRTSER